MNLLKLGFKSIIAKPLSSLLSVILFAFGVTIITSIILTSAILKREISENAKGIDLVVGAKGSPLQIILSSVFHIDFPTGNITLEDANNLSKNRFIASAIPLSLGDSYKGYRIVGTTGEYAKTYEAELSSGEWFSNQLDVTVGSEVAEVLGIRLGDEITSSHGLSAGVGGHEDHPFKVAGILAPTGKVIDRLILTSSESVWDVHSDHAEDGHNHSDSVFLLAKLGLEVNEQQLAHESITALLVKYRSPMAAVQLPRIVNNTSNLQAASPPFETARLFNIIGVGVDVINILGLVIIIISASSIFIALLNSLKERKYELAIMRAMGAGRGKIFALILIEGMLLTFIGLLSGFFLAHFGLFLLASSIPQLKGSAFYFDVQEWWILSGGIFVGLVAAFIPSILAYKANISETLAKA